MADSYVTTEECGAFRKTFRSINTVLFVCVTAIIGMLCGATWAGYTAKAELNTHKEVQEEHDKHIKEDLTEIKLMLRSIGAKVP